MNLKEELIKYLDAGYPILFINSYEEIKTDTIIRRTVGNRKILEWNGATGFSEFSTKNAIIEDKTLVDTLRFLSADDDNLNRKLLVLKDMTPYLEESEVIALLKSICHKIENGLDTAIIIVSTVIKIPKELEKFTTILETDYLSENEIREQIRSFSDETGNTISEKLLEEMALAFKGLSEFEIENLLASAISTDGLFTRDSLRLIIEQKRQMIMKSNILEMVQVKENVNDIGGLENLKKWLERKSRVYKAINKAAEFGVDMPKGVMITGVPGCGKSLTAKATASMFEVPLLKLDMGRIMGKYVGESETNMRNAINLAEAISPCVLWVDELEKAFAGVSGSGHEVTMRLFGTFLTWMQDKTAPVFVIATANDISHLPPELLRKGRFDEIFYVGLPNQAERKKIFEIHIKKRRKQDIDQIDINSLVSSTEGFSGADIEGVVVEAVENAFGDAVEKNVDIKDAALTTDYLLSSINNTKSLSVIMKDQLKALKKYYEDNHFKNASL